MQLNPSASRFPGGADAPRRRKAPLLRGALTGLFLGLLTCLGALAPASADELDQEAFRSYDVGRGMVSLDVKDAPFADVVAEKIQPATRVNIFIAESARTQRVTVQAIELHWSQVLKFMVQQMNGVIIQESPNLIRISRPKPFTYDFPDEPVRNVIRAIIDFAGANVIISPDVPEDKRIGIVLNNAPWLEALHQVCRTVGLALVEEQYGIYLVVPRDQLELDSGYYRFRYLRPPAPYVGVFSEQSGGSGSSGGGGEGGGGGSSNTKIVDGNPYIPTDDPTAAEDHFPIIRALRAIVEPEGGEVNYIPGSNAIVFTGTKPRIQRLQHIVQQLDIEPPQVFIDMNFIVTSNQDALNLGLQPGNDGNGIAFSMSGADALHQLPFNTGADGLADLISGTPIPPPAVQPATSYGRLSFTQTSNLWRFLQRDTSSRVVQAPKLLALDNQAATIFIGDTVRYARTEATSDENGRLVFGIQEDENSPVNVGFQLLVIPHVIPGEQKIMMTVIPQRTTLTGQGGAVPGFDRFIVGDNFIDLPRVQANTLLTHMILRSGETAVIGGLLQDREEVAVDKIPFLGDLPLAGVAFQGKQTNTVREHLLITIRPQILYGTDAANCLITDELVGRSREVSTEWVDQYGRAARYPGGPPSDPAPVEEAGVFEAPPPAPVIREGSSMLPIAPGR